MNTEFHDSVHVVLIDAVTDFGDWYAGSFNDAYNELLYGDGSNDNGLIDIVEDWQTHYGEADIINPIFGLSASYGGGAGEMGPGSDAEYVDFYDEPRGGGAGIGKHLRAEHIRFIKSK